MVGATLAAAGVSDAVAVGVALVATSPSLCADDAEETLSTSKCIRKIQDKTNSDENYVKNRFQISLTCSRSSSESSSLELEGGHPQPE